MIIQYISQCLLSMNHLFDVIIGSGPDSSVPAIQSKFTHRVPVLDDDEEGFRLPCIRADL